MWSFGSRPIGHSLKTAALHRTAGFTLLEILVVVLIIGVIASFAVLSIGNRTLDDRLEVEARRLRELMTLAADEAVLQGVELSFIQTSEGYAFLILEKDQWNPASDVGPLRARTVTEPLYLELEVEGRTVAPAEPDKTPRAPQVLLLSSGESTAFGLSLRARNFGPYYRLEGDALGHLELNRVEAGT
ncbi:MAG: type II secretion system minor pseudopilin GspH [Nevskiales bacterium]|nr:type II secretion system minor pseudopilin GspH [Nevskiales bacterium]